MLGLFVALDEQSTDSLPCFGPSVQRRRPSVLSD